MPNDHDDEPCPYCGEDDCDDRCPAALLAEEDTPDLGACCICGAEGPQVCVLMMLNARCPTPGKGWGCLTCGLANHGALAVVCASCAAPYQRQERTGIEDALQRVCRGTPGTDGRLPIAALRGEHGHDRRKHPELPQVPPLQPQPGDTRFGYHAEEGQSCRCSRCGETIWEGVVAIRAWPEQGDWQYRYHPTCFGALPVDEDPYSDDDAYPDDPTRDATTNQEDAPYAPDPPA